MSASWRSPSVSSLSNKYFPILGKASRAPALHCRTDALSGSSPNPLKKIAVRPRSQQLEDKPALLYLVDQQPIRLDKGIRFTLATVADQLDGQLSLADISRPQSTDEDEKAGAYSTELLGFLASSCEFEFDDAEMRVLLDLILQIYPHSSDSGLERFNYLRHKYNSLILYSSKKKISSRFGYLKSLIKADIGEEHKHGEDKL